MKELKDNPPLLFALAIGIPLAIAAFLWGIAQIVKAVGTAIAIVAGMISAGTAIEDVVELWALRTAAIALGVGGATIAVKLVVNITQQVKNDTFAWTLPVIAILVGLLVEIDKEFFHAEPVLKHILSAVFAFIMLVGGYLYSRKGTVTKVCAIFLMLSPPVVIFLTIVTAGSADLVEGLSTIRASQWFTIGGIICLTGVIALLGAQLDKTHDNSMQSGAAKPRR